MTYETLDMIADAYNPIMFVLFLLFSVQHWFSGDKYSWAKGLLGIVSCYILMIIDNSLGIWSSLGIDYSTHTAVASALLVFHIHKRHLTSKATIFFVVMFLSYIMLMWYQKYHTILDVVSTILAIGTILFLIYFYKTFRKSDLNESLS